MGFIVQIIIGLLGGVAAGLQASFAGILGQKVGDLGTVFFTSLGAIISASIFVLIIGVDFSNVRSIPRYAFLTGPLMLVIVGALSYTVPRLGTASAVTLSVVAWLTISALVDHFGLFGTPTRSIDITRLAGIGILFLGTWLVAK